MTAAQRARLESLVFSVPHPAQSLDARLEPYVALIAEIERTAIEAERARIVTALLAEHSARGVWAARLVRELPD